LTFGACKKGISMDSIIIKFRGEGKKGCRWYAAHGEFEKGPAALDVVCEMRESLG